MIGIDSEKIELPLLEYSKRKDVALKECYLLLCKDHVLYKVVAEYDRLKEDTSTWEETKANFRFTRPRKNMSDVSMYYDNEEKCWSLSIDFAGVSGCNEWMFNDPKQALKIYEKLSQYMRETEQ